MPEQVSSSNSTVTLPNEVMQARECQLESNTGLTYDDRYQTSPLFRFSEAVIMRENGVYDRLFKQEADANIVMLGQQSVLGFAHGQVMQRIFSWTSVTEAAPS